jgi:hypothetical protein
VNLPHRYLEVFELYSVVEDPLEKERLGYELDTLWSMMTFTQRKQASVLALWRVPLQFALPG